MFRTTLKVIFFYFLGQAASIFSPKSKSAIAFQKLSGSSFNLPQKQRYAYRSVLSGIKGIFNAPVQKVDPKKNSSDLIYDIANNTEKERTEFLEFYGIKGPFNFIASPDFFYFGSALDKFLFLFFSFPIFFHLLIYALFKKDRSGLNSILKNLLITRNALIYVASNENKKIYMFSIYDTNSAFLSLNLMKQGLTISQIASEVPLYMWNKNIITNELILCSDYQLAEIEKFKSSIKFDTFKLFGPELFYKIADKYKGEQIKNSKIGFYSSGGWVRNKLGHLDQGTNMETFENRILKDLNDILSKKRELTLVIYPHPREKIFFNNSDMELYNYYKTFLPETNFELNKKSGPNNLLFDDVYIAVCYMTTLIFERAHAKRRSVIVYFKEKDFPLKRDLKYLNIVDDSKQLNEIIEANY